MADENEIENVTPPADETPVVEDTSHLDVAHIPGVTGVVETPVTPKRR